MSVQRSSIFENDVPMKEQLENSILEIGNKPKKFCGFFWFFFIQICIAIILLLFSILLPIWILYG